MNMYHEEDFYVWAENELNNGPRPGLWTKCTAVSEGDLTKAREIKFVIYEDSIINGITI
jgi:hypothetical protein